MSCCALSRLLLTALLCSAALWAAPNPDLQKLDQAMAKILKQAGIPGLAVRVIEGGEVSWQGSYGVLKRGEPAKVDQQTVFQAASLSKPVFAYLVFRLVEQGKLDLDKPLSDYLTNPRITHNVDHGKITARLVLGHRTGLQNWGGDKLDLAFEPGAHFRYSGEGYVYLGEVLEKITGKTVETLAQEEVFKPLGMNNSSYIWQPAFETQAAYSHDSLLEPHQTRRKPEEANTAASLLTTAEDYATFLKAIFDQKGLKASSLEEMFASQGNVDKDAAPAEPAEEAIHWGSGWGLEHVGDRTFFFHWGDNGHAKAFVMGELKSKSAMVYFANGEEGLSVMKPMVDAVFPVEHVVFTWLGYDAYDKPGRDQARLAQKLLSTKDFAQAAAAYAKAAAIAKGDQQLQNAAAWSQQLADVAATPIKLNQTALEAFPGTYGPRALKREGDQLLYQRDGRSPYTLIPLSQKTFALEGLFWFRLEVVTDETGVPSKLVGHYIDGNQDESPRDQSGS